MSRFFSRVLELVPTRRAAVGLFLVAFVVYWVESLGWPMAKGRDTWDYLAYYLQLFDSKPPLSELQVFRTPLTPIVVGLPLDLGGIWLLELVFAVLYAASILAWSATALIFGRVPALFSALLLLVYPAYATLYHQASSDAVFATGLAVWALCLARALDRPSTRRFVVVGAGVALLVLVRPANQVLLPLAVVAPLVAYVAWRRRFALAAVCVVAAVLPLAAWAVHNGLRYDDATVARGGRAWVPFLQVFNANKTISPDNGAASERLAELIEQEVLSREPHAGLDVTLDAYLQNGSNYETVRLIALSDSVLGRGENYEVLFDSALEAIRAHPGIYLRGVTDTFWEFLRQKPLRENVAPREQTEPAAPPPTFESNGSVLPNPQASVLVVGVPYGFVWCASDYIDSCTLADPSRVFSGSRDAGAVSRGGLAGTSLGRGAAVTGGSGRRSRAPQPHHSPVPDTGAVARGRCRRAALAAATGMAHDRPPLGRCVPRPAHPRGVAGCRARVRAARVPGVHRDCALRACR